MKRSTSLTPINGNKSGSLLIANSHSDTTTYSTLSTPTISQKNRLIVHSPPLTNTQNYLNLMKNKVKRKTPATTTTTTNFTKKNRNKQKTEAVKFWLFKGISQVWVFFPSMTLLCINSILQHLGSQRQSNNFI